MAANPILATKFDGTLAVSSVALTKLVLNEVVPHSTVESSLNALPFTVRVKSVAPA